MNQILVNIVPANRNKTRVRADLQKLLPELHTQTLVALIELCPEELRPFKITRCKMACRTNSRRTGDFADVLDCILANVEFPRIMQCLLEYQTWISGAIKVAL